MHNVQENIGILVFIFGTSPKEYMGFIDKISPVHHVYRFFSRKVYKRFDLFSSFIEYNRKELKFKP